jgi:hypothetical protein
MVDMDGSVRGELVTACSNNVASEAKASMLGLVGRGYP